MRLIEIERAVDDQRNDQDPAYSLTRHLELLIAMMGEAQLLRASQPDPFR